MTDPAHTRTWVRDLVRSGLLAPEAEYAEVREVIAADHPELDAPSCATEWIATARAEWETDARSWVRPTDYERLQGAFERLTGRGVVVLQGCADHWEAKAAVERAAVQSECRGVAWFTPADVWHAIDEAMLEVNLWHADTANAAPGDALLEEVLGVIADAGLAAHFDEGRIEVTARWQRPVDPG